MLIIAGTFEVDPEGRDVFIAARVPLMTRSRSEPGCLAYAFTADPIEPGRVLLYERWEDQAALDAHFAVLRDDATLATLPPATSSKVVIYEVGAERPLRR